MNIIDALNTGKVVFFDCAETRYYKKVNGEFYYSDNLRDWIKSSIKESVFRNTEKWSILNNKTFY